MFKRTFGGIFGSKQQSPPVGTSASHEWSPVSNPQDPALTHQSSESSFTVPRKPIATTTESRAADHDGHGAYHSVGGVAGNRTQAKEKSLLRIWWPEIIHCFLLLGAFLAVVATVRPYEGRPLPKWPYRLNINALISIYMVILKGSILLVTAEGLSQLKWKWFAQERPLRDLETYDRASRGPWGALILLRRLRFRELIASVGAFITVATLLVDPFAQQVVTTVDCLLPHSEGIAAIPRSNSFNEPGKHTGAAQVAIGLPLQNVMNAGIFNPGQSVPTECTTGNCTFTGTYHTVGYCSQCNDTTNLITVNTETVEGDYQSYNMTLNTTRWEGYETNISAHMGYGLHPDYLVMSSSGGISNLLAGYVAGPKSPSCPKVCPSLAPENKDECNKNWDQLQFGCTSLTQGALGGGINSDPAMGAATCSLQSCVRTYSAKIRLGRLDEFLEATYEGPFGPGEPGTYLDTVLDLDCVPDSTKKALTAFGYILPTDTQWLPFNQSTNDTVPNPVLKAPDGDVEISGDCVYQIGHINMMSIDTFMAGFLNGTVTSGSYAYDFQGPMQLQAIFQEGNFTFPYIEGVWRNMSDSITGYMREHGKANFSKPARGIAWQSQTCVRIHWWFLAYPAFLVILAILFMGMMLAETRRRDVSRNDWKSSTLALLFHGLDRQTVAVSQATARTTSLEDMKSLARGTQVTLVRTGGGWQFAGSGHDLK